MAYFYRYGTATPGVNADTGLAGSDYQVPAGRRAVIRRVDGFTLAALNNTWFLNTTTVALIATVPAHVFAVGRAGIGAVGTDPFVYIDATAAAVNVCLSQQNSSGAVAVSGSYSGITQ